MPQVIDLDGLPEPVAHAIAEAVRQLKDSYSGPAAVPAPPRKLTDGEANRLLDELLDTLPPMPSLSDKQLSRECIYETDDDTV